MTFTQEPSFSGRHRHEAAVQNSGIAWTVLRPSGFFQNFSEGFLFPSIQEHDGFISASGNGSAAMIDAGDIAAVASEVFLSEGHDGKTYHLTGPTAPTMDEVALILSDAADRVIRHESVSPETMTDMMIGGGVPPQYAEMLVRDMTAIRDGEAAQISGDVHRILGRQPVSFTQFAEQNAQV